MTSSLWKVSRLGFISIIIEIQVWCVKSTEYKEQHRISDLSWGFWCFYFCEQNTPDRCLNNYIELRRCIFKVLQNINYTKDPISPHTPLPHTPPSSFLWGFMWPLWVRPLKRSTCRHQFLVQMPKAKVSWLLCIVRLVSKTDNAMHFTLLVKQASVDFTSHLYFIIDCLRPKFVFWT